MIVSWNWLTEYLRLDMPVDTLTDRLALSGLNHESTGDAGGDFAIDLEVTSNRPDCLCHIGVAREISVLFDKPLKVPNPQPKAKGKPVEDYASVRIDDATLCSRFTARVIRGVKIGPSPWWLRKRLETLGQRSVNNVADITNYVMFECGQPLHAYDLAGLKGHAIIVRRGVQGESMVAINQKKYEFTPEMLVIADAERPVGLAGVMGGFDTEISDKTTNILIEAAQFDAMSIRRTVRALNLPSEASRRFERTLDPAMTEWASRRVAELILKLAGGVLAPGLIDMGGADIVRTPVTLRLDQIPRILGITIDEPTIIRILQALGLNQESSEVGSTTWTPPSWRSDLEREIDLIEEVARIHGFEHIPDDRSVPLTSTTRGPRERVENAAREVLIGLGFDEAATFSLVGEPFSHALETDSTGPAITVEHTSRKRENHLRRSLSLSLLEARAGNEARGNTDADLFEIAQVYHRSDGPLPSEPTRLAIVGGHDFFGMKGVVEGLLAKFHLDGQLEAKPMTNDLFAPGRGAQLFLNDHSLGYLGEVERSKRDTLGLRTACAVAELSFDLIRERAILVAHHQDMPPFPAVTRDLSLVVDKTLPWSDLASQAKQAAGPHMETVSYLDTFAGGNLPPDKQSVHFSLKFRHADRTLTGEEVETSIQSVIQACSDTFAATLRS